MDQLRYILLARSLVLDEIDNIYCIDCSDDWNEQYISDLYTLLKKVSANPFYKLSPKDKSDLVLLLSNRIHLIDDEFSELDCESHLTDDELLLKIMREDCSTLLSKLVS